MENKATGDSNLNGSPGQCPNCQAILPPKVYVYISSLSSKVLLKEDLHVSTKDKIDG